MENDSKNSHWIYMLRTTQQQHAQLSLLADQKANILIASNSIILSLTLSRIETLQDFWCTYTMLLMSIVSILLSLLVVAPLTVPKKRSKLNKDHLNPLFFDHFSHLSHAEYQALMSDIMETPEKVKEAMVKDIYQLGRVLHGRKYPFLKLSALVFIYGIIISLILLLIQLISG
jgi:lysine/ornithine N-monooxygenase